LMEQCDKQNEGSGKPSCRGMPEKSSQVKKTETTNLVQKTARLETASYLQEGDDEDEEEYEYVAPEEDPSLADKHCGTAIDCEVYEIFRDAKEIEAKQKARQEELKKMKEKAGALVEIDDIDDIYDIDASAMSSRIVPVELMTTGVNKSACRIKDLDKMIDDTAQLQAGDSPQAGNAAGAIATGLAVGGSMYGAIGGVLTVGAPTIAAAAGPVGIVALAAGMSIASTLIPMFAGGPEPITEDTIRNVAGEMIKANNEKVLKLVENQVNQVAQCLEYKIEAGLRKVKDDWRFEAMLTKATETTAQYGHLKDITRNDIGAYNSDANNIAIKCNTIVTFTGYLNTNDASALRMLALMVPVAKQWYDVCYANAWSWMAAHYKVAAAGQHHNSWKIGTILNKAKTTMDQFTAYFVAAAHKASNRPNKNFMLAYAHTARSNSRLFNILKGHSDYGLVYPQKGKYYASWIENSNQFWCRTCSFSQWNKLGRRKKECTGMDPWDYQQFCRGGRGGRWRMLAEVDNKWCEPQTCTYNYYQTSTNWHGRKVSSASALPQQSAHKDKKAAYWRGDEWGYYSYVCSQWRINMGSWHDQAYGLRHCDAQGGVSYPTGFKNRAA